MDAIYARQSIDKKGSLSIEGQIELCRKFTVDDALVFSDKGFSGKNTKRPAFGELMEAVGFTDIRIFGDKKLAPPEAHCVRWFMAARRPLTEEAPPSVGERMTELPEA